MWSSEDKRRSRPRLCLRWDHTSRPWSSSIPLRSCGQEPVQWHLVLILGRYWHWYKVSRSHPYDWRRHCLGYWREVQFQEHSASKLEIHPMDRCGKPALHCMDEDCRPTNLLKAVWCDHIGPSQRRLSAWHHKQLRCELIRGKQVLQALDSQLFGRRQLVRCLLLPRPWISLHALFNTLPYHEL